MSIENTIIASVIFERSYLTRGYTLSEDGKDERRHIDHYGRKLLRMNQRGRIKPTDTDEDIAAALTIGVWTWLFWQIAPDLLLWIVMAIRRRIREQTTDAGATQS